MIFPFFCARKTRFFLREIWTERRVSEDTDGGEHALILAHYFSSRTPQIETLCALFFRSRWEHFSKPLSGRERGISLRSSERERERARVKTYTFIRIKRERIREKFWADRAASSQSRTSFWSDKRLDSTRANLSLFIPRDHRRREIGKK